MIDPLKNITNGINLMVEKKYSDTGYTDSYVAFLDILGMKNLVNQDYAVLRSIFNVVEAGKELYSNTTFTSGDKFISSNQVKMTIMSDTIVLSIDSTRENAFSKIAGLSSYLIRNLIMEPKLPIFIRGAITKGDIFHDEDIVFGPALVDAYILETEVASSMRCIISDALHSVEEFITYEATTTSALHQDPEDDRHFIKFAREENFDILLDSADKIIASDVAPNIKSKYEWLINYVSRVQNA